MILVFNNLEMSFLEIFKKTEIVVFVNHNKNNFFLIKNNHLSAMIFQRSYSDQTKYFLCQF